MGVGIIGGLFLLIGTIFFNIYSTKIDNIKEEKVEQLKLEAGYPQLVPYKSGILIPETNNTIKQATIYTEYKNEGRRLAFDVTIRGFIITNDFSTVEHNDTNLSPNPIGPGPNIAYIYYTNIKDLSDFYYVFEISYMDKISNKKFSQTYFYHYYNPNNKAIFFDCDIEQIEILRSRVNYKLKSLGTSSLE